MPDIDRILRMLDVEAESNFVQAEAIDAINALLADLAAERERSHEARQDATHYALDFAKAAKERDAALAALRKIAALDVPFPETNMEGYASMAVVTAREALAAIDAVLKGGDND